MDISKLGSASGGISQYQAQISNRSNNIDLEIAQKTNEAFRQKVDKIIQDNAVQQDRVNQLKENVFQTLGGNINTYA